MVARELYDHRRDRAKGYLEKENIADSKEFANVMEKMSGQLAMIFD